MISGELRMRAWHFLTSPLYRLAVHAKTDQFRKREHFQILPLGMGAFRRFRMPELLADISRCFAEANPPASILFFELRVNCRFEPLKR